MTAYRFSQVEKSWGSFLLRVDGLHLERGQIYAVTGPNGCGKTSLLRLLSLLDPPETGHVHFNDEEVGYSNGSSRLNLQRQVAYLMQHPYLFNMNVYDNIAYGLRLRHVPVKEIHRRVQDVIEQLALEPFSRRNARTLSGGEVQRVALARTLVLDAEVMLLDEFTAGVDRQHVETVERYVQELNAERGTTVVFTTHSSNQAKRLSDCSITITNGAVCAVEQEKAVKD